ncbi:MAG: cobalamin biosynthesis protein [Desulfovibrionaceae bacterium]|nr:cobalamin biosynthesis protein [Desulfovibrionaceae bacterium]
MTDGAAALLVALAVVLDLAVGDPRGWPHPVRALGAAANALERAARSWARRRAERATAGAAAGEAQETARDRARERALRLAGVAAVAVLAGGAWGAARLAMALPGVGWAAGLYLAYAGLALGSLLRECRDAARAVRSGTLEEARAAVGLLVSRDTSALERPALARALAETLSENLGDGFAAPLFYLALGGPPLLWIYKAVSTLDSMWGYRTERWRSLGWAAARLDDVLAFAPARLAALALLAAAPFMGLGLGPARHGRGASLLGKVRRDARTMASPNAGWPMAAAAWIMGAPMGGPAVYFGVAVQKPVLGPRPAAAGQGGAGGGGTDQGATQGAPSPDGWDDARLAGLLRLCRAAGLLLAAAAVAALWALA